MPGFYLRNSNSGGLADSTFQYGRPGDTPIVGDWDGNGTDTPGVVRSGNAWYLKNSLGGGEADISFIYGRPGDMPIVGDWDGNGTDTPGVVRGGNAWYLKNSLGGGEANISFKYCPGHWRYSYLTRAGRDQCSRSGARVTWRRGIRD